MSRAHRSDRMSRDRFSLVTEPDAPAAAGPCTARSCASRMMDGSQQHVCHEQGSCNHRVACDNTVNAGCAMFAKCKRDDCNLQRSGAARGIRGWTAGALQPPQRLRGDEEQSIGDGWSESARILLPVAGGKGTPALQPVREAISGLNAGRMLLISARTNGCQGHRLTCPCAVSAGLNCR